MCECDSRAAGRSAAPAASDFLSLEISMCKPIHSEPATESADLANSE